jgi:hypothetical protein
MTQRNINAAEALRFLRTFSNLFSNTPFVERLKLPFYGFYEARKHLWVQLNTLPLRSQAQGESIKDWQLLEIFFELIEEIQGDLESKNVLLQGKDFWWINVLWVSDELVLHKV